MMEDDRQDEEGIRETVAMAAGLETTTNGFGLLKEQTKRFHVFISYRVKTDAALAERLSDKLRTRIVEAAKTNSALRDVQFQVFLDRQSLVAGEDYKNQFMGALKDSCLVIPIISEPAMGMFQHIQEDVEDSVLTEWEAALNLKSEGRIEVLPILIGKTVDQNAYHRFTAFSTSSIPDIHQTTHQRPARQIISDMLSIQGIFLDPNDMEDRLESLCKRFSEEMWPRYRHLWHDPEGLAPESFYQCVQCGADYRESTNAEGGCGYHRKQVGMFGEIYECCRDSTPCMRGKHRSSHHSDYTYSKYFEWVWSITENESQIQPLLYTLSQDHHFTSQRTGAEARIGILSASHPTHPSKVFVYLEGMDQSDIFFKMFSKEDMEGVDPGAIIGETKRLREGFQDGESVASAKWIADEKEKVAIGVELYSKSSTAETPNTYQVYFSYKSPTSPIPTLDRIIPLSVSRFGERKLDPAATHYPRFPKTTLQKNSHSFTIPTPRPPEKFPCEARNGSLLSLRCLGVANFSPRNNDRFVIEIAAENLDASAAICVTGAEVWWKMREFLDVEGETKEGLAWEKAVKINVGEVWNPSEPTKPFPCTIQPRGATKFLVIVDLEQPKSLEGVGFMRAILGPMLFDVDFTCVGDTSTSLIIENTFTETTIQQLFWSDLPDAPSTSTPLQICSRAHRSLSTLKFWSEAPPPNPTTTDEWNRTIASVAFMGGTRNITVGQLRNAVLKAESGGGVVQVVAEAQTRGDFVVKVIGLVDLGCRRVYGLMIKVLPREKKAEECWVGFLKVPEYGDAFAKPYTEDDAKWGYTVDVDVWEPKEVEEELLEGFKDIEPPNYVDQPFTAFERRRPLAPPPSLHDTTSGGKTKERSEAAVEKMMGLLTPIACEETKLSLGFHNDSPLVKVVVDAVKVAMDAQAKAFDEKLNEIVKLMTNRAEDPLREVSSRGLGSIKKASEEGMNTESSRGDHAVAQHPQVDEALTVITKWLDTNDPPSGSDDKVPWASLQIAIDALSKHENGPARVYTETDQHQEMAASTPGEVPVEQTLVSMSKRIEAIETQSREGAATSTSIADSEKWETLLQTLEVMSKRMEAIETQPREVLTASTSPPWETLQQTLDAMATRMEAQQQPPQVIAASVSSHDSAKWEVMQQTLDAMSKRMEALETQSRQAVAAAPSPPLETLQQTLDAMSKRIEELSMQSREPVAAAPTSDSLNWEALHQTLASMSKRMEAIEVQPREMVSSAPTDSSSNWQVLHQTLEVVSKRLDGIEAKTSESEAWLSVQEKLGVMLERLDPSTRDVKSGSDRSKILMPEVPLSVTDVKTEMIASRMEAIQNGLAELGVHSSSLPEERDGDEVDDTCTGIRNVLLEIRERLDRLEASSVPIKDENVEPKEGVTKLVSLMEGVEVRLERFERTLADLAKRGVDREWEHVDDATPTASASMGPPSRRSKNRLSAVFESSRARSLSIREATTETTPTLNSTPLSPPRGSSLIPEDDDLALVDRLESLETRLDALPGLFKASLHTALDSHADLLSSLVSMAVESRLSAFDDQLYAATSSPASANSAARRQRSSTLSSAGVNGGRWGVLPSPSPGGHAGGAQYPTGGSGGSGAPRPPSSASSEQGAGGWFSGVFAGMGGK
ncbi:hypothetical protein HDU67_006361 [Dinochytrium kinnereticum]|nr:hypothetical protein HDU67_006361 [Dinochytrium kinnereticum]